MSVSPSVHALCVARRLRLAACAGLIAAAVFAAAPACAQTTSWSVSTAADLTAALVQSYSNSVASPGIVNTISLANSISGTSQWIVDANVAIMGNGHAIDMQNADRAFFIFGGTVALSDLTIRNGNATGGAGVGGGGGARASAARSSWAAARTTAGRAR